MEKFNDKDYSKSKPWRNFNELCDQTDSIIFSESRKVTSVYQSWPSYWKTRSTDWYRSLCLTRENIAIPHWTPSPLCDDTFYFERKLNEILHSATVRRRSSSAIMRCCLNKSTSEQERDEFVPTGWDRVDRTVYEMKRCLSVASTEEQFQAIGMLGREALITTAPPSCRDTGKSRTARTGRRPECRSSRFPRLPQRGAAGNTAPPPRQARAGSRRAAGRWVRKRLLPGIPEFPLESLSR